MCSHYRLIVRIEPIDEDAQVITGHPATRLKQVPLRGEAIFEAEIAAHAQRLAGEAAKDVLAMNQDAHP